MLILQNPDYFYYNVCNLIIDKDDEHDHLNRRNIEPSPARCTSGFIPSQNISWLSKNVMVINLFTHTFEHY